MAAEQVRAEWACIDDAEGVRLAAWSGDALDGLRRLDAAGLARALKILPRSVVASPDALPSAAAMPGTWAVNEGDVTFVPRFPFLTGRSYAVLVRASPHDEFALIPLPDRAVATAPPTSTVVAIHPAVDEVPRNLLRCYVEFSGPMSEGDAAACVRVVDAGTRDERAGALLDMEPELWDPERRRLTVLFDPARIKRGLVPHRKAGYPLTEGAAVTMVVDRGFRDTFGRPLVAGASRTYRVGPDVRSRVDPHAWSLDVPASGGRAPIGVTFDRPLDHALTGRCLTVVDPAGRRLAGAGTVGGQDRSWSFTPDAPWTAGAHHLVVRTVLEDLAGNSVARVFDRDLDDAAHGSRDTPTVSVAFTPVGAQRPS